jgi:hypothetical protein
MRSSSVVRVTLLVTGITLLLPVAAAAARRYSDRVEGYEYFATSTDGRFVGIARGALPGGWNVEVKHTALCISCSKTAAITGGRFELATTRSGVPKLTIGTFSGGTVEVTSTGAHCTNQAFVVKGILSRVGRVRRGQGRGAFDATLMHYRRSVLGRCVTFAASVKGTLTVSF